jgi:hypothetical protein
VRSLQVQNSCLLTRLLHQLYTDSAESWVWTSLSDSPLDDTVRRSTVLCGSHWASLMRLLPLYHAISRVQLGDGAWTTFWHDH